MIVHIRILCTRENFLVNMSPEFILTILLYVLMIRYDVYLHQDLASLDTAPDLRGDHATEHPHLFPGDLVLGVGRETGIHDLLNLQQFIII